jgi:hypothetical protein
LEFRVVERRLASGVEVSLARGRTLREAHEESRFVEEGCLYGKVFPAWRIDLSEAYRAQLESLVLAWQKRHWGAWVDEVARGNGVVHIRLLRCDFDGTSKTTEVVDELVIDASTEGAVVAAAEGAEKLRQRAHQINAELDDRIESLIAEDRTTRETHSARTREAKGLQQILEDIERAVDGL